MAQLQALTLDQYLFDRDARRAEAEAPDPPPSSVDVVAADGMRLVGTHYPARGAKRAPAVVIAGATGVRQRYYARFAAWLAGQGVDVLTFDYRGIGDSLDGDIGDSPARMRDWGALDLAAALDWTADALGARAVGVVGHSAGGQLVGLLPDVRRVAAVVTVGSQSGDFRLWPAPARWRMALLWYGLVPGVTRAAGFLPGRLGVGESLPAGVALEWARWCRTRGYFDGDASVDVRTRLGEVRAPLLGYSFDDDPYAPPAAVDALLSLYANADVRRRKVGASARLGHFGFFRSRARERYWTEVRDFLRESLEGAAAGA
jgi:predicted alpha/beta hydrolase